MLDKLFKLRLAMHYTNSHSYVGGYPDVYVVAASLEEAKQKATLFYKEPNKVVAGIIFSEEIEGLVQEPPSELTRNILSEKSV